MRIPSAVAAMLCAALAACDASPAALVPSVAASATPVTALATVSPTTSADATPRPTPRPTPSPKPLSEPAPPSGVDFYYKPSEDTVEITVAWEEPTGKGTTIRVYGVTQCFPGPAFPETLPGGNDSEFGLAGPCLVKGTPLPDQVRELIAEVPASRGKASWTSTWVPRDDLQWSPTGPDDSTYASIVIRASNDAGNSKFIIAEPGQWCADCIWSAPLP